VFTLNDMIVTGCGDENIVEAKLNLRHFNLADENPKLAVNDAKVIESLKQRWNLLRQ